MNNRPVKLADNDELRNTVNEQARIIAAQATEIKKLREALTAYEQDHAKYEHDLGVEFGMAFPPDNCDCDLCKSARDLLKGGQQ